MNTIEIKSFNATAFHLQDSLITLAHSLPSYAQQQRQILQKMTLARKVSYCL